MVAHNIATTASNHGGRVLSYVFDGVYVLASAEDKLREIFDVTAPMVYEATGIRLALKDVAGGKVATFVPPCLPPLLRDAKVRGVLQRLHAVGHNCIPWSFVALVPSLADSARFSTFSERPGPHTYMEVAELASDACHVEVMDREALLVPGQYLCHADAGETPQAHCQAVQVLDQETAVVLKPDDAGAPRPCRVATETLRRSELIRIRPGVALSALQRGDQPFLRTIAGAGPV